MEVLLAFMLVVVREVLLCMLPLVLQVLAALLLWEIALLGLGLDFLLTREFDSAGKNPAREGYSWSFGRSTSTPCLEEVEIWCFAIGVR